jgi:hypothetical protein
MADNLANNNNVQQLQAGVRVVFQDNDRLPSRLNDNEEWLRLNGLRAADDHEYGSSLSERNRFETLAKLEAKEKYQREIHASAFKEALEDEALQQSIKTKSLHAWKDERIEIQSAQQSFLVPLGALAEVSDTVYTMASSRRYMATNGRNEEGTLCPVQLSLQEYSAGAVQEFLDLALGKKSISNIQDTHVVDCCHLSHYLQCHAVLEGTNQVLLGQVDNENCLSLCQMADQLDLPDLFEKSLFHMLAWLDHLESQEAYADFSSELKGRIAGIRSIVTKQYQSRARQSTAAAANTRAKKMLSLYFTSLDEYIAIFAETVQYHRERLEEAMEQNSIDYSHYTQSKIEKQELRVLTLVAMLKEQKRMFSTHKNASPQSHCPIEQ